jgi:hypothetical protein
MQLYVHRPKLESVRDVVGLSAGSYSSDPQVIELERSGLFMVKVLGFPFLLGYNVAV